MVALLGIHRLVEPVIRCILYSHWIHPRRGLPAVRLIPIDLSFLKQVMGVQLGKQLILIIMGVFSPFILRIH